MQQCPRLKDSGMNSLCTELRKSESIEMNATHENDENDSHFTAPNLGIRQSTGDVPKQTETQQIGKLLMLVEAMRIERTTWVRWWQPSMERQRL
jgi:hypothetical protein